MTDEELKALVAENSRAIRQMREDGEKQRAEAEKQRAEAEKQRPEDRQKADRQWAEYQKQWQEGRQESERIWQEVLASRRETDRLIGSLERRFGEFVNAFGDYTECVIRPSLERILRERFGMTSVFPLRTQHEGEDIQVDLVGHAGEEIDEVYLVEIKSHLREDGIQQILRHLRRFPRLIPEHRGKRLFGVLAALKVPENRRIQALKEGLYVVTIQDDVFELSTPDDFEPRAFGLRSLAGE